jgi:3-hydroxyacyl-[acyl-carrier-protein] dehydratase
MISKSDILTILPHQAPFRFVDEIIRWMKIASKDIILLRKTSFFIADIFLSMAITPAVLLTECCAQIGLVCFGIFLLDLQGYPINNDKLPLFTSSNMQYYKKVFPGENFW